MQLVADTQQGVITLYDMVSDGAMAVLLLERSEFPRMKRADVAVAESANAISPMPRWVRVAEREGLTLILRFDKHFAVYRLPRRTRVTLLQSS